MKGLATRRHHKFRMRARAVRIFKNLNWWDFGNYIRSEQAKESAKYWADNMRKCTCYMCRGPKYRDTRHKRKEN